MSMDADGNLEVAPDGFHHPLHIPGEAPTVRVAQNQRLGPTSSGCLQGLQRIGGVGPVAVEKVLRVIDDPSSLGDEPGDALLDHGKVLVAVDTQDFVHMQGPALPDEGAHSGT
jgi:hypothetical protein